MQQVKIGEFVIEICQEEDMTYYAEVKNLPGCFSVGKDLVELKANILEAIKSYIKSVKKDFEQTNLKISLDKCQNSLA